MEITIGLNHWLYLAVIIVVITAMIMKRDVVLPCLIGIFLIGLVHTSSLVGATQTLFRALLVAGEDLFDIMLVIALMVAMLKSLQRIGADVLMVSPAKSFMKTPTVAFLVLGAVMYIAALFFWPTPATALVGVILIPVAVNAGLPAINAAMAVNILGHGMALSGDWVIQGAPGLTERSAGLAPGAVLGDVVILSLITGVVAMGVAIYMIQKDIKAAKGQPKSVLINDAKEVKITSTSKFFATLVPVAFLAVIVTMVYLKIRGGSATALLGGTATAMLVFSTLANEKGKALEEIVGHIREGLMYAVKIFAPVIPIAGFFFLGAGAAESILGEGAPKLLFDLGSQMAQAIPLNKFALSFGNMIIGIITGLDGSGFSGLPLTASLAQALGGPAGVRVEAMAAIGQMGAVWSGGGTLTAWAFGLVAAAGIAGVSPLELARKNFIPVMSGLVVASIVAAVFLM
jgi:hypothetical protein